MTTQPHLSLLETLTLHTYHDNSTPSLAVRNSDTMFWKPAWQIDLIIVVRQKAEASKCLNYNTIILDWIPNKNNTQTQSKIFRANDAFTTVFDSFCMEEMSKYPTSVGNFFFCHLVDLQAYHFPKTCVRISKPFKGLIIKSVKTRRSFRLVPIPLAFVLSR